MAKKKEKAKKKKGLKKPAKSKRNEKEEVCEIFELEKGGKEKIIKACGEIEKAPASKKQIIQENRILRNILIACGVIIVFVISLFLISYFVKSFEYNGVKFNTERYCDAKPCLTVYRTFFPIYSSVTGQHIADYNFYIRTDPRKLKDIPFDGELALMKNVVINMTEDFNCNGDGVIAVANMIKPFEMLRANVMKDDSAGCDSQGRYMFLRIQEGNRTGVEQFGPSCYNINVNNCEILMATERFMMETFVKVNERLNAAKPS